MNNEEFYERVAEILQCDHTPNPFPYRKRTRWNNRKPGSGRFEGHGIVRVFGDSVHVALTFPKYWAIIKGKQNTLDALISLMATNH